MQIETNRRSLLTGAAGMVAAGVAVASTTVAIAASGKADDTIGADLLALIAAHRCASDEDRRLDEVHTRNPTRESAKASDRANEANSNAQWDVMHHPARNIHELRLKLEKADEYGILDDSVAEHLGPIILADVRRITGGEG